MMDKNIDRRFALRSFSASDMTGWSALLSLMPESVAEVHSSEPLCEDPVSEVVGYEGRSHDASVNEAIASKKNSRWRIVGFSGIVPIFRGKETFDTLKKFHTIALPSSTDGEMAERSIATVLKTVVAKATLGSNPSLSAISRHSRYGRILKWLKRRAC
jgi:hypothetical protein